jgi:pyruvate/2-oxoacid:ferredoxin oxidoreductase alpha subunit
MVMEPIPPAPPVAPRRRRVRFRAMASASGHRFSSGRCLRISRLIRSTRRRGLFRSRKLRFVRPFPTEAVAEALSKFKAVGVVETSTSYGGAMRGGNLIHEVRAALYDVPKRPLTTSFMAGLGGDVIRLEEFYWMAETLAAAVKQGKVDKYVYWVGFEAAA